MRDSNADIDIAAIRAFSDELYIEFRDVIGPWAEQIQSNLRGHVEGGDDKRQQFSGGDSGRTLGSNDGDYVGNFVGRWHADNAVDGAAWVGRVVDGLEYLSLASAIVCEKLQGVDEQSGARLRAASTSAERRTD